MIRVQHIDHVALAVTDLDKSIAWYQKHLGLERRHADLWDGPPIMLRAGETCLALFPGEPPEPGAEPRPIRMLHLAFRVDRDAFDRAKASLADAEIPTRGADHENCRALYFCDPDGHKLELTVYES